MKKIISYILLVPVYFLTLLLRVPWVSRVFVPLAEWLQRRQFFEQFLNFWLQCGLISAYLQAEKPSDARRVSEEILVGPNGNDAAGEQTAFDDMDRFIQLWKIAERYHKFGAELPPEATRALKSVSEKYGYGEEEVPSEPDPSDFLKFLDELYTVIIEKGERAGSIPPGVFEP